MAGQQSILGGSVRRLGAVAMGLILVMALLALEASPASAKVTKPKITKFASSPKSVTTADGTITLSATIANAESCTLSSTLPVNTLPVSSNGCFGGSLSQTAILPLNGTKKAEKYKFTLTAIGSVTKSKKLTVTVAAGAGRPPLSGVKSVVGSGSAADDSPPTYCAVLNSGGVECWGDNSAGELGDGTTTGPDQCNGSLPCSTTPVPVVGVGDVGTLTGVESLAQSGGQLDSFCALLTSGGVDCWGGDSEGQLGAGGLGGQQTCGPPSNACSASPVPVVGIGDPGNLASSLVSDGGSSTYCAIVTLGGVDCWGFGFDGELGDGSGSSSSTPVAVSGLGGSDPASQATSLASGGQASSYCAVLGSGGVDCWGADGSGELGDGPPVGSPCPHGDYCAYIPVAVVDTTGVGQLSGVKSVVAGQLDYCAVLDSGGLDCWGSNLLGALGAGTAPDNSCQSGDCSSIPVPVLGVGGSGTLSDVYSAVSDGYSNNGLPGFCALLTTGGVDCWGDETWGVLGNGVGTEGDYSDFPVQVLDTAGSNPLSGAVDDPGTLLSDGQGFCVVLTIGGVADGVDCWGQDDNGDLGAGPNLDCFACSIPLSVIGPTGSGDLSNVTSLATDGGGDGSIGLHQVGYCALLAGGTVDCWGANVYGPLGNGTNTAAPSPVSVFAAAPT
jgi:hypothetical protein